jgi:glycosyltransferase involved in cell wall biosynthesis
LLPDLTGSCECWAWEHGDPTPSFFEGDAADRANVQRHKIQHVYPVLRGVVAISEFIRHDIQAPGAIVIPNGCDHAPDLGSKNLQDLPADPAAPLRLGTLMRLGSGEARYKGNALFVELCRRLKALGVAVEPHVMGRGLPSDAAPFEEQGIRVHLNAPDAEKWTYLRGLDVFMSCSQWEGFNLPLVEAEAVGTIGMAFDTGAHPEVTPFVVSSLDEAVELVRALAVNRTHLLESSRRSYQFARSRFRWADAADALINTVLSGDGVPPSKRHSAGAAPRLSPLLLARKGIRALRDEGVAATTAKGARFVWKRLNRP